jgi:hypothetical protein
MVGTISEKRYCPMVNFYFFDGKLVTSDTDSLNRLVKFRDGFICRNTRDNTMNIYTSDGKIDTITYREDGVSSMVHNNKYIVYQIDKNVYIGLLKDFVVYGSVFSPSFNSQLLMNDINVSVAYLTDSLILQLDTEQTKRIDRLPLRENRALSVKTFDIRSGVIFEAGYCIFADSPSGKYIIISNPTSGSISSVFRNVERSIGSIIGSVNKITFEVKPIIPLQDHIDPKAISATFIWVLDDIMLFIHPRSKSPEPYLINLINLNTVEVIDLYEAVPDSITPGYYFKENKRVFFIPDRSMLRRARELLSPHTKINLNTLGLVKEIPTSVTDRIGRYV